MDILCLQNSNDFVSQILKCLEKSKTEKKVIESELEKCLYAVKYLTSSFYKLRMVKEKIEIETTHNKMKEGINTLYIINLE